MSKLPQIKPTKLLRFFQKQGFIITRQVGSHTRLVHADGRKITSHFIGIKINSRILVDLFVELQQYLKKNNLEEVIELQNIYSLHITLYYLKKDLLSEDKDAIRHTLENIHETHKDFIIAVDQLSYFKKPEKNHLGYISCLQVHELQKLNEDIASKYKQNQIPENQYTYIPHISLFRVVNNEIFEKHKEDIDNLMHEKLNEIKNENLFRGVFLFEVNSEFHPEIQFISTL